MAEAPLGGPGLRGARAVRAAPEAGRAGQIAGGGRYDTLLADLGAPQPVPAVGSAIHTERLLAAVRGGA